MPVKSKEPIDVHAIREKLRLNQPQLARLLGVTKGAVSQWESGASSPSVTTAYMLRDLEAKANDNGENAKSNANIGIVLEIKLTADPQILGILDAIIEKLRG